MRSCDHRATSVSPNLGQSGHGQARTDVFLPERPYRAAQVAQQVLVSGDAELKGDWGEWRRRRGRMEVEGDRSRLARAIELKYKDTISTGHCGIQRDEAAHGDVDSFEVALGDCWALRQNGMQPGLVVRDPRRSWQRGHYNPRQLGNCD